HRISRRRLDDDNDSALVGRQEIKAVVNVGIAVREDPGRSRIRDRLPFEPGLNGDRGTNGVESRDIGQIDECVDAVEGEALADLTNIKPRAAEDAVAPGSRVTGIAVPSPPAHESR